MFRLCAAVSGQSEARWAGPKAALGTFEDGEGMSVDSKRAKAVSGLPPAFAAAAVAMFGCSPMAWASGIVSESPLRPASRAPSVPEAWCGFCRQVSKSSETLQGSSMDKQIAGGQQ